MERISTTNSTKSKDQVRWLRNWIGGHFRSNLSTWFDRKLTIQVWKFIRRLFYFKQMDFQYALWQAHKLLVNPQQLYKGFQYRFVLSPVMICDNSNQKNDKRTIRPRWSCLFGFIGIDICNYHIILWNNEWFSDTQNALSLALVRLCWLRRTWNSGKSFKPNNVSPWLTNVSAKKLTNTDTLFTSSEKAASIFWYMCNKFLLAHPRSNGNDLEWGFCFGMDSNSINSTDNGFSRSLESR